MSSPAAIKVSVCMIAYNHQDYISKAIDSILMQKTSFPFEIIIGDDSSKDDTRKICEEYALKHPGIIRYYYREKNIGMMPNFINILESSVGKYVAICEGDDYWTDDNKLQMQADFLDANPEYSLCCHSNSVLAKGQLIPANKNITEQFKTVKTEEYLIDPFFHTTSYFFRNSAQPKPYPDWYYNVLAGDHFLVLFLAMKGKIGYLNKNMSVFRNHGSSVSFTRTARDIKQNFVYHLEQFDQYSNSTFHTTIHKVIQKWDLVYKIYDPISYWKKLLYFFQNIGFYFRNFRYVGGMKLFIKYLLPGQVLQRVKG